jgi:hypothetical protein
MAILEKGIEFTGSIGNMSAYRMKGIDKIIVRTKGGGSRKKIAKSDSCIRLRENASEFGIRAKAGSNIRKMLTYVKHLADHNITPRLNSLANAIQAYDTKSERGRRLVPFSACRNLLTGYSLNDKYHFDGVVRHPLEFSLNRDAYSAVVRIPDLVPGRNLFLPWKAPMYRFIVSLGLLRDSGDLQPVVKTVYTNWQMAIVPLAGSSVELLLSQNLPKIEDTSTLVLAVGIEMGVPVSDAVVVTAKNAGSAKILGVG